MTMTFVMKSTSIQSYITIRESSLCFMTTKTQKITSSYKCVVYGAKVITSMLLDYFLFLAYSAIYYYVSFLAGIYMRPGRTQTGMSSYRSP